MASTGIDYSKWDRMDFSDSDDDEDRPRVTTLSQPSRVTRRSDGTLEVTSSTDEQTTGGAWSETKQKCENGRPAERDVEGATPAAAPHQRKGAKENRTTDKVENQRLADLTKNGGAFVDTVCQSRVYWSQDRIEVVISVEFNTASTPSRDIRVSVSGALPYADRFSAVGSGEGNERERRHGTLTIFTVDSRSSRESVLLRGELPHFVHLAEDEDHVEWGIDDAGHSKDDKNKLVRVTLYKAVPMAGVCIWWSQPLVHCPSIYVEGIEARRTPGGQTTGVDRQQSQQEKMKAVWEEAHEMFREKVKTRKKHSIDLDAAG